MSTLNTSTSDVSFRVRPLGFDRGEVQAFIGNLLNDYAQVTRELDRLRLELAALREAPPEPRAAAPAPVAPPAPAPAPVAEASAIVAASSAREVERILAAAERIAEEIRLRAQQDCDELRAKSERHAEETRLRVQQDCDTAIREADTRATTTVQDADAHATAVMKEAEARAAAVVRDAETRAAELVDGAAQQVVALDRQAATIRAQFTQMRDSFRAANDAATAALRQLASVDEDREPALQAKRA